MFNFAGLKVMILKKICKFRKGKMGEYERLQQTVEEVIKEAIGKYGHFAGEKVEQTIQMKFVGKLGYLWENNFEIVQYYILSYLQDPKVCNIVPTEVEHCVWFNIKCKNTLKEQWKAFAKDLRGGNKPSTAGIMVRNLKKDWVVVDLRNNGSVYCSCPDHNNADFLSCQICRKKVINSDIEKIKTDYQNYFGALAPLTFCYLGSPYLTHSLAREDIPVC